MKNFIVGILLFIFLGAATAFAVEQPLTTNGGTPAIATTETASVTPGWGPSVIGNVGAFYLNGNYQLLSGGFDAGAAYTWQKNGNVNSAGIYLGPQSVQVNSQTKTTLTVMAYVDLFKTSVAQLGVGLGYQFWGSGEGMVAPTRNNTFLAAAVKF